MVDNDTVAKVLGGGAIVILLLAGRGAAGQPPGNGNGGGNGGNGGGGFPPTRTGIYGALYGADMRPPMLQANIELAGVPNLFTVNPASGPVPLGQREDVEDFARQLQNTNPFCRVLGYIATKYGQQPVGYTVADIKNEVDIWATWRDQGLVDGIMWDEQANHNGVLGFYQEITGYARSQGLNIIRGNPGTKTTREYIELNDVTSVHEGTSQPSESSIQDITYFPEYPKERFNYLQDCKSFLDQSYVRMLTKYIGTLYITDVCGDPTRYQVPASYLSQLVQVLEETPAS